MSETDPGSALATMARTCGSAGFTFDDLARAGAEQRMSMGDLADWLARARSSGFVDDLGFDGAIGPRRYRISHGEPEQNLRMAAS